MRFPILLISLILILSSVISAQEKTDNHKSEQIEIKQATKIDEFGEISAAELKPKLERFVELLRKNPTSTGYIVIYLSTNDKPVRQTDLFADKKMKFIRDNMPEMRHLPGMIFIKGGFREKLVAEIWIVPTNSKIYDFLSGQGKLQISQDQAYIVEAEYLNLTEAEKLGNENITKIEEPSTNLGKALVADKNAKAILFFYVNNKNDITNVKSVVEKAVKNIAKKEGFDANRVKVVYGGYRGANELEGWIVPQNAKEPEPTTDEKINFIY